MSPFCLGAMMLGAWGNTDLQDSTSIIRAALDAGINFIDTADVYGAGQSEEFVGKALGRRRDDVVLATKANQPMGEDVNERGNSRRWLTTALDNSLRRLGTDHVDIYQVHRPDPDTDVEETLSALTDLQRVGKIRYFGSSTFPPHEIVYSQWVSERRGLSRFTTEQPPYSMLVRGIEADMLPVAQRFDLGVLTWGPLAGGWLTGAYRVGQEPPPSRRESRLPRRYDLSRPENQHKLEVTEQLARLAEASGMPLAHMALAFVLAHPAVTSVIIGPRTMEHLKSYLGAMELSLSDDILDEIDAIVPPGVNVVAVDGGFVAPPVADASLRRRRSRPVAVLDS